MEYSRAPVCCVQFLSAMHEASLLHEFVLLGAERSPDAPALSHGAQTLSYGALALQVRAVAAGLLALGLQRADRVGRSEKPSCLPAAPACLPMACLP